MKLKEQVFDSCLSKQSTAVESTILTVILAAY